MIETKIKCNFDYHYSYEKGKATLKEAVAAKWWEILVYCGDLQVRQPETGDGFHADAMHACCNAHARELVEKAALELIPDDSPKTMAAPTESPESDDPL